MRANCCGVVVNKTPIFHNEPFLQVVGLTASPGSGKANSIDKAMDHIIKFLGNLDVSIAPVQVEQNLAELLEYSKLDDFGKKQLPDFYQVSKYLFVVAKAGFAIVWFRL